jgi:outer membrane protein assembly factor BamB
MPITPLRLWPLGVIAAIFVVIATAAPFAVPEMDLPFGLLAVVFSGLLIALWWLLYSQARWVERIGAIVIVVAMIVVARIGVHPSIAGGAQNMLAYMLGFSSMTIALAVWALMTPRLRDNWRWPALVATLLIIGAIPLLSIRTNGVHGGGFDLQWRWTPTAEQRLLSKGDEEPKQLAVVTPSPLIEAPKLETTSPIASAKPETTIEIAAPAKPIEPAPEPSPVPAEWPGFRGPNRDSVVRDLRVSADWTTTPPTQMWRRPVGPGWSSFSVRGDILYTQEQRGNDELVSAYRVSTGEPVWRHRDPIRFYESNGGAGPRGTPTIYGTRVFSIGATGMLNALDAATGKVLWAHNATADARREVPMWGISSSPLVVDDVVIVAPYGTLAAYDIKTGALRWTGPSHGGSYSSPQLVTVNGFKQVVILSAPGAVSVNPANGKLLWDHKWEGGAVVQPAVTDDGDILINAMAATGGMGIRRLAITHTGSSWTATEKWTTNGLKPYFNDYVIHKGYAYGFDGSILSCIDLSDGARKWKGGRYGNGQMLLLSDQDLLVVSSEEGEIALVSATPDGFKEVTRFKALDAKTWNHPVIVRDVLLVRNGEEMAAFKLSLTEPAAAIH